MSSTEQQPDDATAPSLRERKKAKTRAALIAVSQRLFMERGYAKTTLEDICAEVEIRPQTLLRYFESKAHLAAAPVTDRFDPLRAELTDPRRSDDAIAVWRRHVAAEARVYARPRTAGEKSVAFNRRMWERGPRRDPIVNALISAAHYGVRDELAAAIAADRGVEPDDLHSVLVASMLLAGHAAVYERWGKRALDLDTLLADLDLVIDYAVESLPRRSAGRLRKVSGR